MTDATPELAQRIEGLDEATALEAAQLLASALDAAPVGHAAGYEVLDRPLEHREDIAVLCRLLLLTAASIDADTRDLVEESIAGAGRKQLVLGGMELVALSVLVLGALQAFLSRGRTAEDEEISVTTREDGSQEVVIRKSVRYGISGNLAKLLGSVPPQ
jgi:hypothetical protein